MSIRATGYKDLTTIMQAEQRKSYQSIMDDCIRFYFDQVIDNFYIKCQTLKILSQEHEKTA